jgi:DeoR family fructose operon transcriptional repressor
LLAEERYRKILSVLEREGSVRVSNLVKLFSMSTETIRRDLEFLEKQGFLRRVYGGAVLTKLNTEKLGFVDREKEHLKEKKEIAEIALRYIEEGQSLALDYGTTTLEVAKAIKNKFENLTIVTNSLIIASELSNMPKYSVIVSGGILKYEEISLFGALALESIGRFHVDTAFISATGISLKEGLTDYILEGIEIQKKMIDISDEVIVLAASNKFDCVSLAKVCDIDRVNMIITDSGLNKSIYDKYSKNGVSIEYK